MELREIEVFLAVAEERHFRKAAERLHLTPSRVSQAVRALERQIGAPLFVRTSRTVQLTGIGEELQASLGPALEQLRSGMARARQHAGQIGERSLRIGFANSVSQETQMALTGDFQRERHVAAVRYTAPALDFMEMLEADRDGVFITWFPCAPSTLSLPRIDTGPALLLEPRVVVVARDHPWAGEPAVDIEDLARHELIVLSGSAQLDPGYADAWVPPVTPQGREITRARHSRLLEEIIEPIRTGGLAHVTIRSLLTTLSGLSDLVAIPLVGLEPFQLIPVWSRSRVTAALADFLGFAEDVAARKGWLRPDR